MPHPFVEYKFSFSAAPDAIHKDLKSALDTQLPKGKGGFTIEKFDDNTKELFVTFTTPGCGWIDALYIHVIPKESSGSEAQITSTSTNVCPGWCGFIRACCACVGGFSDWGKNEEHIFQIMKAVQHKYETKFVKSRGKVLLVHTNDA